MSTKSRIDRYTARQEIRPIRANAITLSSSPRVHHNPSMDELYEMALLQPTCIQTDIPMADHAYVGLSEKNSRILASYTGQDTARSSWARLLTPQPAEIQRDPGLLDTKDRIERLVREVNFHLMQEPLIHTEVFFGKNADFMGKIHFLVPREYAKLAFDLNLNFIRPASPIEPLYRASRPLTIPDLWLVCHPQWVNPAWQAWRNRVTPADREAIAKDPEPKRILMLFDIASCTAYLLGARYFGEAKKACLTMIWDAAIRADIGMPIHGSSKTLYLQNPLATAATAESSSDSPKPNAKAKRSKKKPSETPVAPPALLDQKTVTFITIGLSGSGKSTIGNDPHLDHLKYDQGEKIRLGNDDALVILYEPSKKDHGTIGLEDGCYNKSNDYTPDSFYIKTVQSAENVMASRDEDGRLFLIHEDILNGNGRVQTARHMLQGADDCLDTPHPDYIALLMKDECLPPLMRITDPHLMVSMYMSLASRSSSAENIPIGQMNQLKMIPGANPFNTWGMEQEAESLEKLLSRVGCQGLVLNTGGFYIDAKSNAALQTRKIPKELSLAIYPLIARDKIKWIEWPFFPGTELPEPSSLASIAPDFHLTFNPLSVKDPDAYRELLRQRLLERLRFLLGIKIDRRFVLPMRKVIFEIDTHELRTRGSVSHVDNLDTLIDTGREKTALLVSPV